jgi:hypothetical protein
VLIGRKAAVIGLALSVASLCAAASHAVVSQQMLTGEARSTALQWLSMLQAGDVSGAFQYTVDSTRGPAPPPPPGTPAPEELPRDPLADFRAHPLIQYMTSAGKGSQTQFDQDVDFASGASGEVRVKEQFLVIPAGGSSSSAITVHLTMLRSRPTRLLAGKWLVAEYSGDDLPALAHSN